MDLCCLDHLERQFLFFPSLALVTSSLVGTPCTSEFAINLIRFLLKKTLRHFEIGKLSLKSEKILYKKQEESSKLFI